MITNKTHPRRVVILYWKYAKENQVEVFSNLKILCSRYPQFNYNTLNNYLSKRKRAFENDIVRIERKVVNGLQEPHRKIAMVVARVKKETHNEEMTDLKYWLSRPLAERLAAVTSLRAQFQKTGQRMDKSHVGRRKMKP